MPVPEQTRVLDQIDVSEDHARGAEHDCSNAEKRGLLLVGLFKLAEALFFVAIGAGALHRGSRFPCDSRPDTDARNTQLLQSVNVRPRSTRKHV